MTAGMIGGRPAAGPLLHLIKSAAYDLPFPFNSPGRRYFYSARYALAGGIRALGLKAGDGVLLPAYNCGVEIEPFSRLGIKPGFYRIREDLGIDVDDLRNRLDGNIKAVLVTHFLGFPQPVEEIRRICDDRKVYLIEDCAHALLSVRNGRYLGTFGDVAVFSLLKTLPVANGGILVLNNTDLSSPVNNVRPSRFSAFYYLADLWRQKTAGSPGAAVFERPLVSALWLIANVLKLGISASGKLTGKRTLSLTRPDSFSFIPDVMEWGISPSALNLVSNTDLLSVRDARRRNFNYLLERLKLPAWDGIFALPAPVLPEGICPLFFPLIVEGREKREELYMSLKGAGITSHPWWDTFHPSVPWNEFPEAAYLKDRLFGLPIHQDIQPGHLERMLLKVEKVCRGWRGSHV